jgi:hypothetical protein
MLYMPGWYSSRVVALSIYIIYPYSSFGFVPTRSLEELQECGLILTLVKLGRSYQDMYILQYLLLPL